MIGPDDILGRVGLSRRRFVVLLFVALTACGGGGETHLVRGSASTTEGVPASTSTTAPPTTVSPTAAIAPTKTTPPARTTTTAAPRPRLLVFSRTVAFRHASIEPGIAAVRELGTANGFDVDATEDPAVFTHANLARYRAVLFLSTTGDVLGPDQEAALEQFVRGGGGFAGVHSATDTEYDWPFYEQLVGARFKQHGAVQQATIVVQDPANLSTSGLPARWTRVDEWYDFRTNPRAVTHVLLTLDESTYQGGTMGADHPIAWCHAVGTGRSWYSALGHTNETFAEPLYRSHLLGGIRYVLGVGGSCG
jgi:type 1 glutamine amidotransferase